MSKLLNKNRKAQLITKLYLSLQKYESFNERQQLTQGQILKEYAGKDQVSKQLKKILQSNQKKKNNLKKQLIQGPISVDLTEQMEQLRWRMGILKQNHRPQRSHRQYNSLTVKADDHSQLLDSQPSLTFNQLYNLQKQKFAMLRQRRKTKRTNIQYLDMIGNRESRKQRSKQSNQDRFLEQMRILDQAIEEK